MTAVPLVMTFSASDPTSGAGLQADALTVAALGAHPLTVLTGVTAQNTQGVDWFEPLSEKGIGAQIHSLLTDIEHIDAIKAGVLGSQAAVDALAGVKLRFSDVPLVVDPVMASGRGDRFGQQEVFNRLMQVLLPHVTLLTPNWPEARALTGKRAVHTAAHVFLDQGCQAVLIKGEHQNTPNIVNRLYLADGGYFEFPCPRLPGQYHGSGCTLASACAVGLARGLSIEDAVAFALEFTWSALQGGLTIGQGQQIPDRMHWMQQLSHLGAAA